MQEQTFAFPRHFVVRTSQGQWLYCMYSTIHGTIFCEKNASLFSLAISCDYRLPYMLHVELHDYRLPYMLHVELHDSWLEESELQLSVRQSSGEDEEAVEDDVLSCTSESLTVETITVLSLDAAEVVATLVYQGNETSWSSVSSEESSDVDAARSQKPGPLALIAGGSLGVMTLEFVTMTGPFLS